MDITEEFHKELGELVEKYFKVSKMEFDEDISRTFLQLYHGICRATNRSFFIEPPKPPSVVRLK